LNKLFLSPLHGENLHREEQLKLKGKKELGVNKKEYGNKHAVPVAHWPPSNGLRALARFS
jgi:hypothetical protein